VNNGSQCIIKFVAESEANEANLVLKSTAVGWLVGCLASYTARQGMLNALKAMNIARRNAGEN